jgi:hypothetical protein
VWCRSTPTSPSAVHPRTGGSSMGSPHGGGRSVWNPLSPERTGTARSQELEARFLRSANAWQGDGRL